MYLVVALSYDRRVIYPLLMPSFKFPDKDKEKAKALNGANKTSSSRRKPEDYDGRAAVCGLYTSGGEIMTKLSSRRGKTIWKASSISCVISTLSYLIRMCDICPLRTGRSVLCEFDCVSGRRLQDSTAQFGRPIRHSAATICCPSRSDISTACPNGTQVNITSLINHRLWRPRHPALSQSQRLLVHEPRLQSDRCSGCHYSPGVGP